MQDQRLPAGFTKINRNNNYNTKGLFSTKTIWSDKELPGMHVKISEQALIKHLGYVTTGYVFSRTSVQHNPTKIVKIIPSFPSSTVIPLPRLSLFHGYPSSIVSYPSSTVIPPPSFPLFHRYPYPFFYYSPSLSSPPIGPLLLVLNLLITP